MATTTTDFSRMKIAEIMIPEIYQGTQDVENFIADCNRYFDLCGLDDLNRNMIVKCLIRRDLLPVYEPVPEKNQGFEKKLREAFQKPASLIEDFLEIYNYEKDTETASMFFDKVEKLVTKLMAHKWSEEELTAYFLVHCVKDKEIKREIRMRDAKNVDEIKAVIKKMDAINVEIAGVAAIQKKETYANVLKSRQEYVQRQGYQNQGYQNQRNFKRPVYQSRQENQIYNTREITCWTCKQIGHSSRDCRQRPAQTCFTCGREGHISRLCPEVKQRRKFCWACREEGHVRDECPNICCSNCKRRGHLKFQCRESGAFNPNSGREYSRSRRYEKGHNVAAMRSFDDDMRESNQSEKCDDAIMRDDYPKDRAPSLDEMIGAME